MDWFLHNVLGREFIKDGGSTEMSTPKLHSQCSHSSGVPNDQLPVNSSRTNLGDCPTLPFVRSHARDSVLVYSKQLGLSLRASAGSAGA